MEGLDKKVREDKYNRDWKDLKDLSKVIIKLNLVEELNKVFKNTNSDEFETVKFLIKNELGIDILK
jgi:hypothetical protein